MPEFINIPRLFTGIAEWLACMLFILVLKKKHKAFKTSLISAAFLLILCSFQILAGDWPIYLWIPGMILSVAFMHFFIWACCKQRFVQCLFWTCRAFVLAEFAASLEWQFYYYFTEAFKAQKESLFFKMLIMVVFYLLVYLAAYFLEKRYTKSNEYFIFSYKDLISTAIIAAIIFFISNISFVSGNTPLSGQFPSEIFYIRTLVDLCGLILLYAQQEQRLSLNAKKELYAMDNILNNQYKQYCLSKENIEILNRKFHDMKHMIALMRNERDMDKWEGYLDEMQISIKKFESENKTGNQILNTILTGKALYCVENNITFTYVADGALISFMNVMDICSIFGNALDNAIEAVMSLTQTEEKLIKMALYAQNNFIMIRFENYLKNDNIVFSDGLPITTKSKKEGHGYGMKSIKNSVEKYGGTVSINIKDNWFNLCILFSADVNKKPFEPIVEK